MKYLLTILLAVCAASCVTSSDLQRVADAVRTLEVKEVRTEQDILAVAEEIEDVAREVSDRTDNFLTGLSDAGVGGVGGLLAMLTAAGVNMYRNGQRRQRGEATGLPPKT